ncbi:uncharacterized protein MELLADRAFT_117430 [Melampsora larici-populina 98AG31]|uniref:Uracil-DNA glycosylase-like domain-containing protein n=1 Tax=Melampsora larici-populina (strain 98AG31 / pathotype 3-4-7) TaxID=747676 RepID=F4RX12_MELLP|nr:uncharacterized protein MELLADRAFT_117430 [Melampsora larici-populina 98AG31]EGG03125.1 hypothetical protein MELLADRAFT_117430 [Melampsora larici-populina 98AG31]
MPPRRKPIERSQKDNKQTSIDAFFLTPSKKPKISIQPNQTHPKSKAKSNSKRTNQSKSESNPTSTSKSKLQPISLINSSPITAEPHEAEPEPEAQPDLESCTSLIFNSATSTNTCPTSINEDQLSSFSPSPSPSPTNLSLEFNPIYGLHHSWLGPLQRSFHGIGLTNLHRSICKPTDRIYSKGEIPHRDPGNTINPPFEMLYNWSHLTPLDQVKVVILGTEPCKKEAFSHGLSFSQSVTQKRILGTMSSIHYELSEEFPDQSFKPKHGSLVSWAESGVLLLNIIQTTPRSQTLNHRGIGWERFTDVILDLVNRFGGSSIKGAEFDDEVCLSKGLVFLVWGELAAKRIHQSAIPSSNRNHLILKTSHPQPSTSHLGFIGSNQFKLTNEFLEKTYGSQSKIDWCKLEAIDPIDSLKRKRNH